MPTVSSLLFWFALRSLLIREKNIPKKSQELETGFTNRSSYGKNHDTLHHSQFAPCPAVGFGVALETAPRHVVLLSGGLYRGMDERDDPVILTYAGI